MGDRESRVETLFAELADLPRSEQDRLLGERCADDPALAERLRRMLAEDARGTHGVLAARTTSSTEGAEEHVGPYRLLRVLGRGGMGVVHLAEQEEPIRRLVALKRILPGEHRQTTAARFEGEMQILAQLDHPGIAKVFDAGTSESGLPWFSMEYVAGSPLLEACDQARLGLDGRLRVFLELCDAVQYAHQKGVVHRDLSPRNVLVEERDGRLHPKVIDFGIARVLSVSMGPAASRAPEERPIGTLVSMSPEQAQPSAWETDTRADVYALGVVLYELLSGATPFDLGRLGEVEREEARRIVREEEPPAPSERVAALGHELDAACRARGLTPKALERRLRGDLDWIVARAMKKSRIERYASVSELALDLRHHLAGEPVEAAPSSTTYRMGRFLRRHRMAVGMAGVVLLALVAVIVGLAQRIRAAEAEREAAEAARVIEARDRREAEAMVTIIQHALFYGEAGSREAGLVEMFRLASDDVRMLFRGNEQGEQAARYVLGRSFLALGEEDAARRELERAYELVQANPAGDPLDRFRIVDALTRATRLARGEAAARPLIEESLEAGRLAIGDESWFAPLEPMVRLAAGEEVPTAEALDALRAMDAVLAKAASTDPRLPVLIRISWEASVALRESSPEAGEAYLEALEQNLRALVPEEDLRFLSIIVGWARYELQQGDLERAETLGREAIEASSLPSDHWLRAEAKHVVGLACLALGRPVDAEDALLAARRVAARAARPTAAHERARTSLADLSKWLLALEPEARRELLEDSWSRWVAARDDAGEPEGWWPVTWPEVPADLARDAVALLEALEATDAEQLARGRVRAGRAEEALPDLRDERAPVLWFRALALLELEDEAEAVKVARRAEAIGGPAGRTAEVLALRREVRAKLAGRWE